MQRLPPVLTLALAAAGVGSTAWAGGGDAVYHLTAHGSLDAGVNRLGSVPRGHCLQCHPQRQSPMLPSPVLFGANDNTLCFSCHAGAGGANLFAGQTAYLGSAHANSSAMVWPGPTPLARPAADAGKCLNCHTPHGSKDALGLVPSLEWFREEAACLGCHDANGPAATNISGELGKRSAHPVTTVSGLHTVREGTTGVAFGAGRRHAECVDCHNPHASTVAAPLTGTSRVSVANGAAGTVPTFTYRPAADTTAVKEYELCFKCHSSWTTAPAGQGDLAKLLNPNNESFHPVEAAGKNTTSFMTQSLAGGTGLPHLTTTSVLTCADCHNNDALPPTVSLSSAYTGPLPTGPHGSSASGGNVKFSNAILRAPYRKDLKASAETYAASDFTLCFICHAAAPFSTTSQNSRTDTAFRLHGLHVRGLAGKGSGGTDIAVPGAGQGNAICRECHYNTHGTRGAPWASNASYVRGVNFAPNVTATGSTTNPPSWTPGATAGTGSCALRCHGMSHGPETY